MIPTRFVFKGDVDKARELLGYARKRVAMLFDQDGEPYNDFCTNRITLNSGAVVVATHNYGITYAEVFYPDGSNKKRDEIEEKECYCFPCFSTGKIEKVYIGLTPIDYVGDDTVDPVVPVVVPTDEELRYLPFRYDVSVCLGEEYMLMENHDIRTIGWEEYKLGDLVLVSLDKMMTSNKDTDCCTDRLCLYADDLELSIAPVTLLGGLKEWVLTTTITYM